MFMATTEQRKVRFPDLVRELNRNHSTVTCVMQRLGIHGKRTHPDQGPSRGNCILLTEDEAGLIRLAMAESRTFPNRKRKKTVDAKPLPVLAHVPAPVKTVEQPKPAAPPVWNDFQATARKLAQLAKIFHVSLVMVETDSNGKQKISYEQSNAGEIDL